MAGPLQKEQGSASGRRPELLGAATHAHAPWHGACWYIKAGFLLQQMLAAVQLAPWLLPLSEPFRPPAASCAPSIYSLSVWATMAEGPWVHNAPVSAA